MELDALKAAGMDVDDALDRLLGNEELLAQLVETYARDPSAADLVAALDAGDVAAARAAAHALRGVAGNLSLTELFDLSGLALDMLHASDIAGARALAPRIEAAQRALVDAIGG